jgi:hypothetical protein
MGYDNTDYSAAGKIFHSNDNYSVVVNDDVTGYNVVNDNSGVTEFDAESLPECIFAAENLNVVLVHRTYEWVAKRAQDQAIKDSGLRMATVSELQ